MIRTKLAAIIAGVTFIAAPVSAQERLAMVGQWTVERIGDNSCAITTGVPEPRGGVVKITFLSLPGNVLKLEARGPSPLQRLREESLTIRTSPTGVDLGEGWAKKESGIVPSMVISATLKSGFLSAFRATGRISFTKKSYVGEEAALMPPSVGPAIDAFETCMSLGASVYRASAGPLVEPPLPANLPVKPLGADGWLRSEDFAGFGLASAQLFRAKLAVGPTGGVTGCTVIASTGVNALDQAACTLLKQRARFRAATDEMGKPIAAERIFGADLQTLP